MLPWKVDIRDGKYLPRKIYHVMYYTGVFVSISPGTYEIESTLYIAISKLVLGIFKAFGLLGIGFNYAYLEWLKSRSPSPSICSGKLLLDNLIIMFLKI